MIKDYKEFKNYLEKIDINNKPKLLLHACCGPCSSYCLELLKKYFDITIFYSNDNISPKEEYQKRLDVISNFAKKYHDIKVIYDEYNNDDYNNKIKNHEHDGEKSIRCYLCYELRLEKTCIKAKELGFDFFTTTLSISPYKISKWINEIGYNLQNKYNMYRQDYCGCKYSKEERDKIKNDRIKEENNN
ncbi:MAG: epoxyqueuosine reductase QueH [Acholeplasmatales bacterium]|nr:epoxyqueuosine reductase QueH [Acholeplasmatales bacterium]